jgi:L-2,4-diaminobutyric acid acetyltransferase
VQFRKPLAADGPAITALIAACPPLDRNSRYCNLLQCEHFAGHCIVAEKAGRIVGWVSGYRPPSEPEAFFVWQVAVATEGRGKQLASRMISALLARPAQCDATHLITTITDDNQASWGLFRGLARDWNAPLHRSALFERETHFAGAHATEFLARIGPIDRKTVHEKRG